MRHKHAEVDRQNLYSSWMPHQTHAPSWRLLQMWAADDETFRSRRSGCTHARQSQTLPRCVARRDDDWSGKAGLGAHLQHGFHAGSMAGADEGEAQGHSREAGHLHRHVRVHDQGRQQVRDLRSSSRLTLILVWVPGLNVLAYDRQWLQR